MATINALTTVGMKVAAKKKNRSVISATTVANKSKPKKKSVGRRGVVAPPLKLQELSSAAAIAELSGLDTEKRKERVVALLRRALGANQGLLLDKSAPHVATSTTQERGSAAADLAIATKTLGVPFVLLECGILFEIRKMLFPDGNIEALISANEDGGLKPSASALSLASMDDNTTVTSFTSNGTDGKRGKSSPPTAREGALLIIRALCEKVGTLVEPFVVGAFLAAALDECGSNSSAIRQAAEDTATALVQLAHPWAFPAVVCPLILQSIKRSNEWRVKFNGLERLQQCTLTAPDQTQRLLPKLIPEITGQVWDTKMQVSKAARTTLLALCGTCKNPDVLPSIPAVVNAICKPADTYKAVEELMGTTFIVPVDASTLSILCPVLARALREKLAIHKRAACVVITNMSKLVDQPSAVAPFGPLLVPELRRVAKEVQFEEIRDEALKALNSLTKALGESYMAMERAKKAQKMAGETLRVETEQDRIKAEREAAQKKEEETKQKELEERRKFREAMDAQRELDKIARNENEAKRSEENLKKEAQKRSTKTAKGKCQGCGLKKCRKTCLFYEGK